MARPSVTPHQTPSQAPSRCSTCIRTPIRSDSNFVQSNIQSGRSVLVPATPTKHSSSDPIIHSKSNPSGDIQTQNTPSQPSQSQTRKKTNTTSSAKKKRKSSTKWKRKISKYSDAENSKVRKSYQKKSTQFNDILDYFEAPFHAKEDDQG
ncbi:hypothetical protein PtA15_5A749 [Puccinia triticina]|uniref:Uncharacterized protein n=1 Tax=Puccinia triticina TaxID=208348 RepID=A0ABY7CN04_9BASI|nr:uncharacterized protein PtA15_5A749 [Puccinia triticina]WAQ85175.1 hypothetical protein PtA15_5A749 [Puccinia triticina]